MTASIETIYTEFDTRLRRFILRRVSDPAAAEDILQEVYIRIHARIDTLRDTGKLESWIYQITRNAIVDYYRRKEVTLELPETLPLPDETDEPDATSELASSIHEMISCLPPKYRQALVLTELQGLTQRALADQLGISFSGAKSRVQRAREKLKQALLDCCHFEFDRRGKILSYHSRCGCCSNGRTEEGCHSERGNKRQEGCGDSCSTT